MASESKIAWGRRGKRTSVIALGLVAALAGVAFAYFIATTTVANNLAKGGTLSVSTDLPMDFTGGSGCSTASGVDPTGTDCTTLYPVTTTTKPATPPGVEQPFTVTNNNAVKVNYEIYATCTYCVQNPTSKEAQQFNNLYVDITPESTCPTTAPASLIPCTAPTSKYSGRLADLNSDNILTLDTLDANGAAKTYNVTLWLHDDGTEQPQNILNSWEFVVDARTTGS